MFSIIYNQDILNGHLIYSKKQHEIFSNTTQNSDITILLAYIQIGFSSLTMTSTEIWGYHHNFNWIEKKLSLPHADVGRIQLCNASSDIEPGDSIRYYQSENWVTYFDKEKSLICFGEKHPSQNLDYVEFYSGAIAAIDQTGNLSQIWLHLSFE